MGWLGLEEIHRITSNGSWGLVVNMTDWDDKTYTAVYDNFMIIDHHNNDYDADTIPGGTWRQFHCHHRWV